MLKNKAKIAPDSTRVLRSRALKRALDPGRKDFALRARDARSAHKNTFFYLKIWFFKVNNTFFESDRLAALLMGYCPKYMSKIKMPSYLIVATQDPVGPCFNIMARWYSTPCVSLIWLHWLPETGHQRTHW